MRIAASCALLGVLAVSTAAAQHMLGEGEYDGADVIRYRVLGQADFRSSTPPEELRNASGLLGAATCAYIRTGDETGFRTIQVSADPPRFRSQVQNLSIVAEMNRACSWWNPSQSRFQADYVLEHEQIHFALFELEARRLNAQAPAVEAQAVAEASTPEQAAQDAQQPVHRFLENGLRRVAERNRRFDEDTSLGVHRGSQAVWRARVSQELGEPLR